MIESTNYTDYTNGDRFRELRMLRELRRLTNKQASAKLGATFN